MKLTFYGGARVVTGANYLLETEGAKILIDCGLHQGSAYCEAHNYEKFPYKPSEIDAVFITHAHIDHIGRLPQLKKAGFKGKIFSTPPTKDFAEFLLLDSEHLLREESFKKGLSPLYDINDVLETVKIWEGIAYHQKIQIGGFEIELFNAGHVLGSSSIMVKADGKSIIFSGDLGNIPTPFIQPTEFIKEADYALVESVYGGRIHEELQIRKDVLEDLIEETIKSAGTLMIPAFALERTQELLFELNELVENGRIPKTPVFIDSPLAIKLTSVYQKYSKSQEYFSNESISQINGGDAIFNFPGLKMTLTKEESKEINNVLPPKIIVAGAGMSNGGRILHHELRYLSDPKSAIIFIGFQAEGSLGRRILDGIKKVRILGEEVQVNCKIKSISGYSAHADQNQLMKWVEPMHLSLKKIFVVQGEEDQSMALAQRIKDEYALEAEVPIIGETVVL